MRTSSTSATALRGKLVQVFLWHRGWRVGGGVVDWARCSGGDQRGSVVQIGDSVPPLQPRWGSGRLELVLLGQLRHLRRVRVLSGRVHEKTGVYWGGRLVGFGIAGEPSRAKHGLGGRCKRLLNRSLPVRLVGRVLRCCALTEHCEGVGTRSLDERAESEANGGTGGKVRVVERSVQLVVQLTNPDDPTSYRRERTDDHLLGHSLPVGVLAALPELTLHRWSRVRRLRVRVQHLC
mmetsp:Transcript_22556/g.53348  ORF Transcript_22556/g.53348 Transcript_22556/m.53348 type:complete len:235 (-) Transcript_22556:417-1121(-)